MKKIQFPNKISVKKSNCKEVISRVIQKMTKETRPKSGKEQFSANQDEIVPTILRRFEISSEPLTFFD